LVNALSIMRVMTAVDQQLALPKWMELPSEDLANKVSHGIGVRRDVNWHAEFPLRGAQPW